MAVADVFVSVVTVLIRDADGDVSDEGMNKSSVRVQNNGGVTCTQGRLIKTNVWLPATIHRFSYMRTA